MVGKFEARASQCSWVQVLMLLPTFHPVCVTGLRGWHSPEGAASLLWQMLPFMAPSLPNSAAHPAGRTARQVGLSQCHDPALGSTLLFISPKNKKGKEEKRKLKKICGWNCRCLWPWYNMIMIIPTTISYSGFIQLAKYQPTNSTSTANRLFILMLLLMNQVTRWK